MRVRSVLPDHIGLAPIGLVAPDAGLVSMQQIVQHLAVGDVGRGGDDGVDDLGFAVDPDMRFHSETPLISFLV